MATLDHLMYSVPDLDSAIIELTEKTGVVAEYGGAHAGRGTQNALLSLGEGQYLEIIAPDPKQPLLGTMGEQLLHQPAKLRMWAVATTDLAGIGAIAKRHQLNCQPIIDMDRLTTDKTLLTWKIMPISGLRLLPFFIDWLDCDHPSATAPKGCSLLSFEVITPEGDNYQRFMNTLGIDVVVSAGEYELRAEIQSPRGRVQL